MAKKAPTKKTTARKAPTKPKDEKPKVEVEVITAKEVKETKLPERISGTHRVKFKGNGSNSKLGSKISYPSATNAQLFVDNGWGNIVDE